MLNFIQVSICFLLFLGLGVGLGQGLGFRLGLRLEHSDSLKKIRFDSVRFTLTNRFFDSIRFDNLIKWTLVLYRSHDIIFVNN